MPLLETKGAASAQGFGEFAKVGGPVYIEDVFSTYLYTGTGASQTITNGIDLSGKGGLVWAKCRSNAASNVLYDTARGGNNYINSNTVDPEANGSGTNTTVTFNTNGFTAAADTTGPLNTSGRTYASWSFRKQAKFFDVVTYTGNGANRTISHNLGSVPGCIIIKRTDSSVAWAVYHRSLANTEYMVLNTTAIKATGTTYWNSTTPTATEFSLGTSTDVNANTGTYVAYLFAHDAGGFGLAGTDNVVTCGSYTGNGSATGPTVTLGYEPQWLMIKRATGSADSWYMFDNMRGLYVSSNAFDISDVYLVANTAAIEVSNSGTFVNPTATGFELTTTNAGFNANGSTYIYIAIRRGPMKVPTDATKVFYPTVYTGTNVDNRLVNTTIAPDMVWVRQRNDTVLGGMVVGDRLRNQPYLLTGTTDAEVSDANAFDAQLIGASEFGGTFTSMFGFWCGNDPTAKLNANTASNNHIAEAFKRAPSFFDIVCYTGNGVARAIKHNLGVAPQLMIIKSRGSALGWGVYPNTNEFIRLDLANGYTGSSPGYWDDKTPTATEFYLGDSTFVNANTATYVAYLFATCTGVSKVGFYTGTGGAQTINCGFTTGARFVLIKRTLGIGYDWYVYDSARGITSGNDPYLWINSTAAEVTGTNYVDTDTTGFKITASAGADLNANGQNYLFLAIA